MLKQISDQKISLDSIKQVNVRVLDVGSRIHHDLCKNAFALTLVGLIVTFIVWDEFLVQPYGNILVEYEIEYVDGTILSQETDRDFKCQNAHLHAAPFPKTTSRKFFHSYMNSHHDALHAASSSIVDEITSALQNPPE